jgi:type IV pilus assembly protein PilB
VRAEAVDGKGKPSTAPEGKWPWGSNGPGGLPGETEYLGMEVRMPSLNQNQKPSWEAQLISAGLITDAQLDLALREHQRGGAPLGEVLVQLGFVAPATLAKFLAQEAEAKVVNMGEVSVDREVLSLIPVDLARRFRVMPLWRVNGTLSVAMADPFDVLAVDTLRQVTGMAIEVTAAPVGDILNCIDLHYSRNEVIKESIDQLWDEQGQEPAQALEAVLGRVAVTDEDAPVINLVRQIITRAVNRRASDLHFEPEERMMRVRARLDGVLHPDVLIPKTMQSAVSTRVKILADLDLTETHVPQDGRASLIVGGRQVNLRVSSLPTNHGENIVVRILDPSAQLATLSALGLAPKVEQAFREFVDRPYGVVLVTGPTGSGKTTTLYAVLKAVATMEVSTFTLEDPIEYRMPLVRQTQVHEEIGLTFSAGLRALLRQDPDIILVGETRDTETAQLMVRAALTGHLVFSTLHTNDAAGAIPRLVDMGVEPYLLPASLIAVLAQRLVRTLCPHCKQEISDPARVFAQSRLTPPAGEPRLWRGAGCPHCNRSGFKGRQGIFELMGVDERFHDPIVNRAGAPEYLRRAREAGMRTMFEDGLDKALRGETTIEELLRVTRLAPQ